MSASPLRDAVNSRYANRSPFDASRDTLIACIAVAAIASTASHFYTRGFKKSLFSLAMKVARNIPAAARGIKAEQAKTAAALEAMVINKERDSEAKHVTLPEHGSSQSELLELLTRWSEHEHARWISGSASGTVYHGGAELVDFENKVFSLFSLSNPLHPDIFPYVRKMEAEVVRMVADLFHGSADACGTMTSGGTESILMAMKSYRDRAKFELNIDEPEIVVPRTAHAAFDKAAHYFSLKLVHVPVDSKTGQVSLSAMKRALNRNTIAVIGSAPGFPHGVMDDIEGISEMLADYPQVGLHTDCCLGSFLLPILASQPDRYQIPPFDFLLPRVSSISCDPHKYGFAVKGSSVILYSNNQLRSWQYFVAPEWSGGIYASPSMPGSRPGGLIAATWATMIHIGRDGYVEIANAIMDAATKIRLAITNEIADLRVIGAPIMSVIAFESSDARLNVFAIGEFLSSRHWSLNTLQHPSAIHICVTKLHIGDTADRFISDLKEAVQAVRQSPELYSKGSAAIYGMAASIPDTSIVDELAKAYIDALYKA